MNNKEFEELFQALMAGMPEADGLLIDELKSAAFDALLLNPGCNEDGWKNILAEQYGTEVADVYGDNQEVLEASLTELWNTKYQDLNSGLEYTFNTWAKCFCNDSAIQMYYDLTSRLKEKNV